MVSQPLWWILEIFPLNYWYQNAQGFWEDSFGPNLGKGRIIPDLQPNFHITVKERMEDVSLGYKPKAQYQNGSQVYVQ